MTSAAAMAPSRPQVASDSPPGASEQEPGGVQVAGARRVDHVDRLRRHLDHLVVRHDRGTQLAPGEHREGAVGPDGADGRVEVVDAVEGEDLVGVGEEDVDVVLDELAGTASRWRSTQNRSDNVSATSRPASCAMWAAARNAAWASGRSNRYPSR